MKYKILMSETQLSENARTQVKEYIHLGILYIFIYFVEKLEEKNPYIRNTYCTKLDSVSVCHQNLSFKRVPYTSLIL